METDQSRPEPAHVGPAQHAKWVPIPFGHRYHWFHEDTVHRGVINQEALEKIGARVVPAADPRPNPTHPVSLRVMDHLYEQPRGVDHVAVEICPDPADETYRRVERSRSFGEDGDALFIEEEARFPLQRAMHEAELWMDEYAELAEFY